MVEKFLEFLARDIEQRPEALVELDEAFAARLIELTGDAPVDLDAPIEGVVTAWASAPGRRVGATVDLEPEWIEAVRDARAPAEFASVDAALG
jgi:hypothetical protein